LFAVSRLEEKESELKKEYTKLHERHTEVSLCLLIWPRSDYDSRHCLTALQPQGWGTSLFTCS